MSAYSQDLDTLEVAGLTLKGITRGGIETCLMVQELRLMFDIGMCPPGFQKYRDILVSHGHSDHMGGIGYLVGQRRMTGARPPRIHVPVEVVEPVHRLMAAWAEIEDHKPPYHLFGHAPGESFEMGKSVTATPLRTTHRVPSLGWVIERRTQRLLPEFAHLTGPEIGEKHKQGVTITQTHEEPLLCVTGDTQIEFFKANAIVRRCRVLVHEVTSYDDRSDVEKTRGWGHTHV
ncbi:MAG: MBL fold metallo-hydrolase, partial [Nannocystaceae bacterium]